MITGLYIICEAIWFYDFMQNYYFAYDIYV